MAVCIRCRKLVGYGLGISRKCCSFVATKIFIYNVWMEGLLRKVGSPFFCFRVAGIVVARSIENGILCGSFMLFRPFSAHDSSGF